MIKSLTRHGNSLALIIEKPILDLLKVDAKSKFDVITDGSRLILEPHRGKEKGGLEAWLKTEDKKMGRTYRKLSSPA